MQVKDFKTGTNIEDQILYCISKKSGVSVKGDTYLSLTLRDSSGTIDAKVWNVNDNTSIFDEKDFVKVSGSITTFKDSLQINVTSAYAVPKDSINMEDFCPKCPKNMVDMTAELNKMIDSVKDSNLKALLEAFFKNDKFVTKFNTHSAAKAVHHAYIGGLLEHSLTVAQMSDYMCTLYPKANRDLAVTAALLHDIGKMKELSVFPDNDYTDDGQLLGHIYIGTEMIELYARKIENFPRLLLNELKHCILAHHGKQEFGSPVVPHLIEAMLVHIADEADAKMRRFSDLLEEVDGDNWSASNDFFIGARYRNTII